MNLEGRHALVTGGSSGIGLAVADALLERGMTAHLVARDTERLESAAGGLVARHGAGRARMHACDVTDRDAVASLADVLGREGTPIHVLVNSAGITHPGYFEQLDDAVFDNLMRVNFFGTLNTCRVFSKPMRERGEGYVVNVSSVAGLMGVFGYTAYSASKFAVTGFTESLRAELSPDGVVVCLLCPPDTDTPMLEGERSLSPLETQALNAQAGVLKPDAVARELVEGMRRNRALIVPGGEARLATLAHRIAPGLVERIMQKTIRRARKRR